ncbi:MAG: hypothetical protein WCQ77_03410 [Planctomycetota bacterium]
MNAHFLSFANRRYRGALTRIRREAEALDRFASVRVPDDRWLGADYWRVHADTVRQYRRGFGLFTWKPYVIRRRLEELPAGDLLVYADAGCSLNSEGRARLEEYLALAADHPAQTLAFSLTGKVGEWTKRATLVAAGLDDDNLVRQRPMVLAGILVLRAGPATLEFVREWERRMADVRIVDDSPSPQGEYPEFRAHRHDQSIFTLLAHARSVQTIPDETWWDGAWDQSRRFPIHARRWRHRLPWSQAWLRAGCWPRW